MWYPTDESFFAAQAQENFARAQMEIAAASAHTVHAVDTSANATASSGLLSSLHDVDPDALATVGGVVVLLLIWLVLCGICRFYVCCPCPFCFCYIPCCCGFCLKDEKEKEKENMRSPNDVYHRHDHFVSYPTGKRGGTLAPAAHERYYDHAEVPAYSSLTVDVEEPLLGPPAYTQPRKHETPPPAYHNVPTAPPLS